MNELKLKDWLPQEPWQGPPLPEFLDIYWPWYKPPVAEFKVSDLVISPTEVNLGQAVTISAKVTNIGTQAGDYTVKLGGDFTGEETLTLEPGGSRRISFEVVPTIAKTYSVSVDGLTGTFRATEVPVEVVDFDLTRPTVTPETITPDTDITITCPVTSLCTESQTITAKVIIYEGSILPGHGSVIATKTSPAFSISPGETYNVIVHHTAVAGTIDRRDIEVEIYIAGRLVKQSEWDDVYYIEKPAIPEIVIDFPELTILEVEGIPFTSVGEEEEIVEDWEAFGECLRRRYGPLYEMGWITNGVGLAMCMKAKGAATGETLKQCGIEHPEYLTPFASRIPPAASGLLGTVTGFVQTYGVSPYACLTIPTWVGPLHVTAVGYLPAAGEDCVWYTLTYTLTYWEQSAPHQQMVDGCIEALAPTPFIGLVAILAEPIVMSEMRGVSIIWLNKVTPIDDRWASFWLRFEPAFPAEMPPPAFRALKIAIPPSGEPITTAITSCFSGGYFYKGVYDGEITWDVGRGWYDGAPISPIAGGKFKIKNLAKVTGEGTVVP